MKCSACGKDLPMPNARFCPYCGTALSVGNGFDAPTAAPATTPQPAVPQKSNLTIGIYLRSFGSSTMKELVDFMLDGVGYRDSSETEESMQGRLTPLQNKGHNEDKHMKILSGMETREQAEDLLSQALELCNAEFEICTFDSETKEVIDHFGSKARYEYDIAFQQIGSAIPSEIADLLRNDQTLSSWGFTKTESPEELMDLFLKGDGVLYRGIKDYDTVADLLVRLAHTGGVFKFIRHDTLGLTQDQERSLSRRSYALSLETLGSLSTQQIASVLEDDAIFGKNLLDINVREGIEPGQDFAEGFYSMSGAVDLALKLAQHGLTVTVRETDTEVNDANGNALTRPIACLEPNDDYDDSPLCMKILGCGTADYYQLPNQIEHALARMGWKSHVRLDKIFQPYSGWIDEPKAVHLKLPVVIGIPDSWDACLLFNLLRPTGAEFQIALQSERDYMNVAMYDIGRFI